MGELEDSLITYSRNISEKNSSSGSVYLNSLIYNDKHSTKYYIKNKGVAYKVDSDV